MKNRLSQAIVAVLLLVYLVGNVVASQSFSPLMSRIILRNEVNDARELLGGLEGTGYYEEQYSYLNALYGGVFDIEKSSNEFSSQQAIAEYEEMLLKNPKSRDILVKLALLYKDVHNNEKAREYYSEAQSVDPWLNVEELERLKSN